MEWYNSINTIHTVFNVRKGKGFFSGCSSSISGCSSSIEPKASRNFNVNMQQKYGTAARATAKETIMPGP